jgi:hypothetical protein
MTNKELEQFQADLDAAAAHIAKAAKRLSFIQEQNIQKQCICVYCRKIDCICSESDLGFDIGAKG